MSQEAKKIDKLLKVNSILNYFHETQGVSEGHHIQASPSKKQKPNDYYSKCLYEQHEVLLQDSSENEVKDESAEITIIEVEDDARIEETGLENESFSGGFSSADVSCRNVECINEIKLLKNENDKLKMDLRSVKKMYRTALQTNLMKDLKLAHMENKFKENSIGFSADDYISGNFNRFIIYFTEKELSSLRGLDLRQTTDSAFLRLILKYLYKENMHCLVNKTVTGRSDSDTISPEKMVIVKEIFEERIDGVNLRDENETNQRKKRFKTVLAKVLEKIRFTDLKLPRAKKQLHFLN